MAVLKVWDGSAWVVVGTSAPAVASPLTVDASGVIDISHIEEVGGAPNVGFVAENGNVNLEAAYWAFLASNLRDDGTNWQRYRTTDKGLALAADYAGALHLYDTPAGANPATLTERLRINQAGTSGLEQLYTPGGPGIVTANGVLHLATNLTYDGTNWQRVSTAAHAFMLRLGSDDAQLTVYYAAPGANPVAWTSAYAISRPAARPPTPNAPLGTYAAYGSGWAPWSAPYAASVARDQDGYVHLNGLVAKNAAAAANESMFVLAAGFRPQVEMIFPLSSALATIEVRMSASGSVYATNGLAANNWVALDGIPPFYAYA